MLKNFSEVEMKDFSKASNQSSADLRIPLIQTKNEEKPIYKTVIFLFIFCIIKLRNLVYLADLNQKLRNSYMGLKFQMNQG